MKRLCKSFLVLLLSIGIGVAGYITAYAYSINVSNGYNSLPYEFRVHNTFTSSEGTSMASAAKAWEDAGKGVIAKKSSYTNDVKSYPIKDSTNNVTKYTASSDYLAQCSWWTSSNKITEADINFNPSYTIVPSPTSSQYDMQTIMTHEIGHALGLGHSSDTKTTPVMKPTFSTGEKVRTISSDDIDGIKAIYK